MTYLTSLIAVIVAFVALQQFLLAREKFKLDLFDRRLAVFKATQKFVNEIIKFHGSDKESWKWIQEFHKDAQTATFLFDQETANFIEELWKKGNFVAAAYNFKRNTHEDAVANEEFKKAVKIQEEMFDVQNHLEDKFSRYLKFSNWKYGFIFKILN